MQLNVKFLYSYYIIRKGGSTGKKRVAKKACRKKMAYEEWKQTRLVMMLQKKFDLKTDLNSGVKWQRLEGKQEKIKIFLSGYHQCPAWLISVFDSSQGYTFLPDTLYASPPASCCLWFFCVNSCRQWKLPDLCCFWIAFESRWGYNHTGRKSGNIRR